MCHPSPALILSLLFLIGIFPAPKAKAQCTELLDSHYFIGSFSSPIPTQRPWGYKDMVAQDNLLYLFQKDVGLIIFDITDPTQSTFTGWLRADSYNYDSFYQSGLAVRDSLVYLTTGYSDSSGSLLIASVSNPANPDTVALVETRGSAQDLALLENTLFIAEGFPGLSAYDLTNPTTPVLRDSLVVPGEMTRVECSDGLTFAATKNPHKLHLVDWNDSNDLVSIASHLLPGEINDLSYDDGKLLVTTENGAVLLSVETNSSFAELRIFPEGKDGALLINDEAWMGARTNESGRLVRYDLSVSDPEESLISETWFNYPLLRLIQHGQLVWAAELGGIEWKWNIGASCTALNPTFDQAPSPSARFHWPYLPESWSGKESYALIGDLLFCGSTDKIQAANISNPDQIQFAGYWPISYVVELTGQMGQTLVTTHADIFDQRYWIGFYQPNLGAKTTLEKVGEFELTEGYSLSALGENLLACSVGPEIDLALVDVSDFSTPVIHGPFPQWSNLRYVAIDAETLLALTTQTVFLLDISNPAIPVQLGHWNLDSDVTTAWHCTLEGNKSVIAVDQKMMILDWSQPSNPVLTSTLPYPGGGHFLNQNLVFHYNQSWTQVHEISDPHHPQDLGWYGEYLFRILPHGNRIYAMTGDFGSLENTLVVYDAPCTAVSTVHEEDPAPVSLSMETRLTMVPNPANPRTSVHFHLPRHITGKLLVYDMRGRMVRTISSGEFIQGHQVFVWDGRDDADLVVASGVYLMRLESDSLSARGKVILVR